MKLRIRNPFYFVPSLNEWYNKFIGDQNNIPLNNIAYKYASVSLGWDFGSMAEQERIIKEIEENEKALTDWEILYDSDDLLRIEELRTIDKKPKSKKKLIKEISNLEKTIENMQLEYTILMNKYRTLKYGNADVILSEEINSLQSKNRELKKAFDIMQSEYAILLKEKEPEMIPTPSDKPTEIHLNGATGVNITVPMNRNIIIKP